MSAVAIVCSGQGAQGTDMFKVFGEGPNTAGVIQAARSALGGTDPRDLVAKATDAELHADNVGQILCCTLAMMAWSVLRDAVEPPVVVAGYSVGELAAWGVAGLIAAPDIIRLAEQRSAAMDAATNEASGLVAIRGLPRKALDPICKKHGAYVAIVNAREQILVGGSCAALAAVVADATDQGAQRTTTLPVAVPAHTPILAAASTRFRKALDRTEIAAHLPSGFRLLAGIDGEAIFDVATGKDKLARQISQTVDWGACMTSCREAGVSRILELGPGIALTRMMREAIPGANAHALSEFRSLDGVKRWLTADR